jgi:transcriptional regulator with XRE-family HTH domain
MGAGKVVASPETNKLSADTGTATTTHDTARRALGEFLRTMRGRATPSSGARTNRRRVRGLRREEVAVAAGISLTWYTWLEQGRPVGVSTRTLRAVGRALRLGPPERAHLLRLATAASGVVGRRSVTRDASDGLRALVTNLSPHPVYAVNGLWDVLCRNRAADVVLGDFDREPGCTDNVLRRLLLDADWRERFENWDSVAESAVAQFRAATGHLVGRSVWRQFVASLSAESPRFAEQWSAHAVAPSVSYTKVVRHPVAGRLPMLYASLAPAGEPADVRMIVYAPVDDDTAERIRRLVDSAA